MTEEYLANEFKIDFKIVNKFLDFLLKKNQLINLTNITDRNEMLEKHVYDSLIVTKAYDFNYKKILDAGSGNGFPGILIAILFPNSRITLVDSVYKKISFLKEAIKILNLKNVDVIHCRVEELKENEKYDVVISRALAQLRIYLELVAHLVKINGQIIALKGKNFENELKQSEDTIKKLKLSLILIQKMPLNQNYHVNLIFNKNAQTKIFRSFVSIKKKSL